MTPFEFGYLVSKHAATLEENIATIEHVATRLYGAVTDFAKQDYARGMHGAIPLAAAISGILNAADAPRGYGLQGGLQGAVMGGLGALGAGTGLKFVGPDATPAKKLLGGAGGFLAGTLLGKGLAGEDVRSKAKREKEEASPTTILDISFGGATPPAGQERLTN